MAAVPRTNRPIEHVEPQAPQGPLVRVAGSSPPTTLVERVSRAIERAVDATLERLMGETFAERMTRVPLALGPSGVDPFGLDPQWARYVFVTVALLYRKYFRAEVHDIDKVPSGRVLLVANHSGQLPIDGALIAAAMFLDAKTPRIVRAMIEKWAGSLPFVSLVFTRVGQVIGVPENAKRLLEQGEALLVFPEGTRGITKTFDQRYKLTDFGLGFMRLAIETDTPIVPVAVVGGEEQYISVGNVERLARLFRMPAFPIVPQLLFPGGQLPLPTKYRLWFGEPMRFTGDPDDDDAVIDEKVWLVRQTIQAMLHRALKERQHVFW
ncbi:MAG TPA: lysophospholipid acyltransferase family protein [Polyangiaceae bacterium]|nr:lysophospholipid acyltransferase family protein [Polyangiaceae bacterium]